MGQTAGTTQEERGWLGGAGEGSQEGPQEGGHRGAARGL